MDASLKLEDAVPKILSLIENGKWTPALESTQKILSSEIADFSNPTFLHGISSIVEGFLEFGLYKEAGKVFDNIPKIFFGKKEEEISEILNHGRDYEIYGFSVYMEDVPYKERWISPRLINVLSQTKQIEEWYPAQILLDDGEIIVKFVDVAKKRSYVKAFELDEWESFGGIIPRKDECLFCEIACYEDTTTKVFTDMRSVRKMMSVIAE